MVWGYTVHSSSFHSCIAIQLFALDNIEHPIASFHAPHRLPNTWTKAKLELNSGAQEIQDLVITSFLFIDLNRKETGIISQNEERNLTRWRNENPRIRRGVTTMKWMPPTMYSLSGERI